MPAQYLTFAYCGECCRRHEGYSVYIPICATLKWFISSCSLRVCHFPAFGCPSLTLAESKWILCLFGFVHTGMQYFDVCRKWVHPYLLGSFHTGMQYVEVVECNDPAFRAEPLGGQPTISFPYPLTFPFSFFLQPWLCALSMPQLPSLQHSNITHLPTKLV